MGDVNDVVEEECLLEVKSCRVRKQFLQWKLRHCIMSELQGSTKTPS